jgi:hypothetical protein
MKTIELLLPTCCWCHSAHDHVIGITMQHQKALQLIHSNICRYLTTYSYQNCCFGQLKHFKKNLLDLRRTSTSANIFYTNWSIDCVLVCVVPQNSVCGTNTFYNELHREIRTPMKLRPLDSSAQNIANFASFKAQLIWQVRWLLTKKEHLHAGVKENLVMFLRFERFFSQSTAEMQRPSVKKAVQKTQCDAIMCPFGD